MCIYSLAVVTLCPLQLVATGLLSSLKSIGSIFFFDFLALTIFAVIGIQLFRVSYIHDIK